MSAAKSILKQFDKAAAKLADYNCNEAIVKIDQADALDLLAEQLLN